MKRTLILLSVLGLLVGACGKDDKKTNASDGTTQTTVKNDSSGGGNEADGALKAQLLDQSDLPSGFTVESTEERDPTSDSKSDTDFCPELDQLDKDYPGQREAEGNYQRASGEDSASPKVISLNEQISRFADGNEADDAFAAFEKGFPKCQTFSDTDKTDGSTTTGTFEKISFAKAGDDTYGTKLKLKQSQAGGQSVELDGYFVVLRSGRHIILLMTVGFGDELSLSQFEGLAKKAADKAA